MIHKVGACEGIVVVVQPVLELVPCTAIPAFLPRAGPVRLCLGLFSTSWIVPIGAYNLTDFELVVFDVHPSCPAGVLECGTAMDDARLLTTLAGVDHADSRRCIVQHLPIREALS